MTIEQIMKWLESKNVDMWANWRISDPARRRMAAEWFKAQSDECAKFYMDSLYGPNEARWDVV